MKRYLTLKTQKGTSLVELLVYFALLSIVLLIATDLILKSGEFSLEFSSKNNIQSDSRFISNRLVNNIHQATNINTPANLGDLDSTLVLTIGNETHTYTLIGTDLQYTKETPPPGATTKTANINSSLTKINSISFQRLGNTGGKNMIKITFEIEDVKGKKGTSTNKTFETMVGIR